MLRRITPTRQRKKRQVSDMLLFRKVDLESGMVLWASGLLMGIRAYDPDHRWGFFVRLPIIPQFTAAVAAALLGAVW